jgi:hypothetical protein
VSERRSEAVVEVVEPLRESEQWSGPEWQRPTFQPGHLTRATHGALVQASTLSREPRTQELAETIRDSQPVYLPCDEGIVQRLAIVYVRIERAAAAIEHMEALAFSQDAPTASFRIEWMAGLRGDLARWMRLASELEDRLGRSPASRAKLALHVASAVREQTRTDLLARYGSENGHQDTVEGEASEDADG